MRIAPLTLALLLLMPALPGGFPMVSGDGSRVPVEGAGSSGSLFGMPGGGSPEAVRPAPLGRLEAQMTVAGGGTLSSAPPVSLRLPGGRTESLEVRTHRGYPAFRARALDTLGWRWRVEGGRILVEHRTGIRMAFREGSPWFTWEDELLQLAHEPYGLGDDVWLPLQVMADLFPGMLPGAYRYDPGARVLWVEGALADAPPPEAGTTPTRGPSTGGAAAPAPSAEAQAAEARAQAEAGPGPSAPGERAPRSRAVIIDAGHGGTEPGAVGPGGTLEKEVALAVALALARELESDPWIEVHLTRDRDVTVPIWDRGELATEWKGERPGVFVSIHANAIGNQPATRGFETYFLSEARTEHERRVAAAENAAFYRERPDAAPLVDDPLLAGILRDLITHDHQHWSALLAEEVQRGLAGFHPGPDRGVKQAPLAVLTNALMPSVLVELGFITNREEERLMTHPDFHRDSARAMARAIRAFFDRYPPGGTG